MSAFAGSRTPRSPRVETVIRPPAPRPGVTATPRELARRAAAHPRTAAAVALANVVPLVGVLAGGWRVGTVLIVYWAESGVVLAASLVAGLIAAEPPAEGGEWDWDDRDDRDDQDGQDGRGADTRPNDRSGGRPAESADDRAADLVRIRRGWPPIRRRNVPVVASMGLLFGLFWVVHGLFVFVFAAALSGPDGPLPGASAGLAVLAAAAGHGIEFHREQVVDGRHRRVGPESAVSSVLPRTAALHVALLVGGGLTAAVAGVVPRAGVALLAVLVALKAPVELSAAVDRQSAG